MGMECWRLMAPSSLLVLNSPTQAASASFFPVLATTQVIDIGTVSRI